MTETLIVEPSGLFFAVCLPKKGIAQTSAFEGNQTRRKHNRYPGTRHGDAKPQNKVFMAKRIGLLQHAREEA